VGGLAGSMQTSAGMKEKEHHKNRDVSKILSEDLVDLYNEKIGRRYEQMKAEKKLLQSNKNLDTIKKDTDEKIDTLSAVGSGEEIGQAKQRRLSKYSKSGLITDEDAKNNSKLKDINERINNLNLLNPEFSKLIEEKYKVQILELYEFHRRKDQEQKDQDQNTDTKVDSEDHATRIAKLQHEQELADFEERGGLKSILDELFNPKDKSIELDSVYQLKQL
jgi:hypothetical protein